MPLVSFDKFLSKVAKSGAFCRAAENCASPCVSTVKRDLTEIFLKEAKILLHLTKFSEKQDKNLIKFAQYREKALVSKEIS
jgi:hypothetical protein